MIIGAGLIGVGMNMPRPADKVVVFDDFNRADDLLTAGSTKTGQVWTPVGGAFGILGNRLYSPGKTSASILHVDPIIKDYEVSATVIGQFVAGQVQGFFNLMFHMTDAANYMMARMFIGNLEVYKFVAGAATVVASTPFVAQDWIPYKLKVRCQGTNVRVSVNGVELINLTLSGTDATTFPNYSKAGFRMSFNGGVKDDPTADDFEVRKL